MQIGKWLSWQGVSASVKFIFKEMQFLHSQTEVT